MTKKVVLVFIIILFLPNIVFGEVKSNEKNILILNSYAEYYSWSRNELDGVIDGLNEKYPHANIFIENMDTKRHSSLDYYNKLKKIYEYKYQNIIFDSAITLDNNAFEFAIKNRRILLNDAPIFFSGINNIKNYTSSYKKNTYGVAEESSVIETLEFAKTCNPKINKIIYFVENTITGKLETVRIKEKIKKFNDIEFINISNRNFSDILSYVEENNDMNSIILVPFFVKDTDDNEYTNKEVIEELSKVSNVPIYGLYSFQFGHGIVGGKIIDPYSQGYEAVSIMKDYFDNKIKEDAYYKSVEVNKYKIDYKQIQKFGFDNVNLPEDSIIINKPVGFLEENLIYIYMTLTIFILVIIYIGILRRQIDLKTKKINDYYKKMIKKEKEIVEFKKMVGLGEIVVGIAHEINTPLGSSMTGIDYSIKQSEKVKNKLINNRISRNELKDYIIKTLDSGKLIKRNLDEISSLIDEFKMINASIDNRKTNVKVGKIINETIMLYRNILNEEKVLIYYNCNENLEMFVDKNKLKNILSALIDNSLQHGFVDKNKGVIQINVKEDSEKIYLEYIDDGIGISQDGIQKIYEPFYSDKKGSNKGLGLYYVYNSVKSMKGKIETFSELGNGTEFKLIFDKGKL